MVSGDAWRLSPFSHVRLSSVSFQISLTEAICWRVVMLASCGDECELASFLSEAEDSLSLYDRLSGCRRVFQQVRTPGMTSIFVRKAADLTVGADGNMSSLQTDQPTFLRGENTLRRSAEKRACDRGGDVDVTDGWHQIWGKRSAAREEDRVPYCQCGSACRDTKASTHNLWSPSEVGSSNRREAATSWPRYGIYDIVR